MIVKCKDNNGLGDCPYRRFCLAAMNDRTITGCSLPFVWNGLMDIAGAVVQHTVHVQEEKYEIDRSGRTAEGLAGR